MPIIAGRASAAYGAGFGAVTTVPYAGPFGAYDALAGITVGASAVSSVTFSGIPTEYKHLQIRINYAPTAGGILKMNFNGDTGANYTGHILAGEGTGSAYGGVPSVSPNAICTTYTAGTTFGAVIVDVLDYNNLTKNKVTKSIGGSDRNGAGDVEFDSNVWLNTSAITSIVFSHQNGNIGALSSFALYGVK
jgi:hypothetical protein